MMTLYWQSLSDFLQMGGYGRFVWGSWGLALGLWTVEALTARARHARALASLATEEPHDAGPGSAADAR